jgi:hypothetical protein
VVTQFLVLILKMQSHLKDILNLEPWKGYLITVYLKSIFKNKL